MWSLFENEGPQWAHKFLDALEDTGVNTPFVQEIRQAANLLKDEDYKKPTFGNAPNSTLLVIFLHLITI